MCKENLGLLDKNLPIRPDEESPNLATELLSVYDFYRVGATENGYLIPKDEYANFQNPIFYIEEYFADEAPKAKVTPVPYDTTIGSPYRQMRNMCVFKTDETISKDDNPHIEGAAETEMLSYLKYVKCK